MPRSIKRATSCDLDILHRLTVDALVAEMRRLKRSKASAPANLIAQAIKLLSVTGSTEPERVRTKEDRLAGRTVSGDVVSSAERLVAHLGKYS
jgi:hypothetical protein